MRILSELIFIPTNVGINRLLHDISRFSILFRDQLFFIFNQLLSIRSLGRRVEQVNNVKTETQMTLYCSKCKNTGFTMCPNYTENL